LGAGCQQRQYFIIFDGLSILFDLGLLSGFKWSHTYDLWIFRGKIFKKNFWILMETKEPGCNKIVIQNER